MTRDCDPAPRAAAAAPHRLARVLRTLRYWRRAFVHDVRWARVERKTYRTAREFDPRIQFDGPQLGFYWFYTPGFHSEFPTKDEQGFAIVELYGRWFRQPLTHCHWTMGHFHRYLESGDEADRQRFLDSVDLLLEARTRRPVPNGGTADVWEYDFEFPQCAPHPVPWISAITQGSAIAVLIRAYQLTGQAKYLDAVHDAEAIYDVDVADGGIRSRDAEGNIYYEEYPFPDGGHHVLNGFISSILGVYDVYRATGDQRAKRLFDQGVATLSAPGVLDRYDLGYWSAYDQFTRQTGRSVSLHYHRLHVRQLTVLHKITGIELFAQTAQRWYRYGLSPWCSLRNSLVKVRWHLGEAPRYWRRLTGGGV
jgi:hypothetical protein